MARYYHETLAGYWPDRIRFVDEHYETLPFPYVEIETPEFSMEAKWDRDCLVGYLASWSATRRFIEAHGCLPIEDQFKELAVLWGERSIQRTIRWPLYIRIGRLPSS
jgi:hypothetical protein